MGLNYLPVINCICFLFLYHSLFNVEYNLLISCNMNFICYKNCNVTQITADEIFIACVVKMKKSYVLYYIVFGITVGNKHNKNSYIQTVDLAYFFTKFQNIVPFYFLI